MATFSSVVDQIFTQHLAQYGSPQLSVTRTELGDSETISQFDIDRETPYVNPGMLLEIDDEAMLIVRTHENHIEVRRGMLDTQVAAHNIGALVKVAPRFFRQQVGIEMFSELASWDQQVFTEATQDVVWPNGSTTLVDLPDFGGFDPFRILEAVQTVSTNEPDWHVSSLSLRQNPDAEFGYQLFSVRQRQADLRVTFGCHFNTDDLDLQTDLMTVGLAARHVEILRLGAAARLIRSSEILRTNTTVQGQPRYAEEVPPQYQQQLADSLDEMRDAAYNRERDRLRMRWGA